jgi:hypothetical protein
MSILAMTMIGAASLAAAQAGSMDKKADADQVTVTGCVATGSGAGSYTLTNAAISSAMADKASMAKDKAMPMEKDTMAAHHAMSYSLMGGDDLAAHVGHKVAVTGTVAKDTADAKPMPEAHDKMAMKTATLNVASDKMISATCP